MKRRAWQDVAAPTGIQPTCASQPPLTRCNVHNARSSKPKPPTLKPTDDFQANSHNEEYQACTAVARRTSSKVASKTVFGHLEDPAVGWSTIAVCLGCRLVTMRSSLPNNTLPKRNTMQIGHIKSINRPRRQHQKHRCRRARRASGSTTPSLGRQGSFHETTWLKAQTACTNDHMC